MDEQQEQQQQEMKDQLKELLDEYFGDQTSDHFKSNLIEFLRSHDCRAILSAAVDGDAFAEMFTYTPLFGHLDLLQACVEHGMNVDIKDKNNVTALIFACIHDQAEMTTYLLEHHANIDFQDCDDQTALMSACLHGYPNIVRLLLDHNADIDLRDKQGETALDLAKNEEIKEILLNHVNSSYVLK